MDQIDNGSVFNTTTRPTSTTTATATGRKNSQNEPASSSYWTSWVQNPVYNVGFLVFVIVVLLCISPEDNVRIQEFMNRSKSGGGGGTIHLDSKAIKVENVDKNYYGSRLLTFLVKPTGLDIDMVNFISCQLIALLLSFGMRRIQYSHTDADEDTHDLPGQVSNGGVSSSKSTSSNPSNTHRVAVDKKDIDRIVLIRLWFTLVTGILICYFCFGHEIIHVVLLSGISYVTIRIFMRNRRAEQDDDHDHDDVLNKVTQQDNSDTTLRRRNINESNRASAAAPPTPTKEDIDEKDTLNLMPWAVFAVSMSYLSFLHIKRLQEYNYSLDITGPMMVLTQKVTSLAFSLRDGLSCKKKRSASHENCEGDERYQSNLLRDNAVREVPSILEYSSFIFQFQSMLAGPLVFYGAFSQFIRLKPAIYYNNEVVKWPNPPFILVLRKIVMSIFFAVMFLKLGPIFPINRLRDSEFLETGVVFKFFFLLCLTTIERAKYYHAWMLADAVCNCSGLGYDWKKKNWNLITNVYPMGFELGTNLKESLENWNIGTGKWLRHVVYERVYNVDPKKGATRKLFLTYLTSAVWHGFYPGYYLTFLSGALFTSAARTVRRYIRPYFVQDPRQSRTAFSTLRKGFYDILTFIATRLVMGYCCFTFIILDFLPSIAIYRTMYFALHIAAISVMFIFPLIFKKYKKSDSTGNDRMEAKSNPEIVKESTSSESHEGGKQHLDQNAEKSQKVDGKERSTKWEDDFESKANEKEMKGQQAKEYSSDSYSEEKPEPVLLDRSKEIIDSSNSSISKERIIIKTPVIDDNTHFQHLNNHPPLITFNNKLKTG